MVPMVSVAEKPPRGNHPTEEAAPYTWQLSLLPGLLSALPPQMLQEKGGPAEAQKPGDIRGRVSP
jgi:hypothetical protein